MIVFQALNLSSRISDGTSSEGEDCFWTSNFDLFDLVDSAMMDVGGEELFNYNHREI